MEGEGSGEGEGKGGTTPPLLVQFGPGGRRRAAYPGCPSLSLRPIWPITSPRGVPVTLRYSSFLRNHPEYFRCPNIVVQYINLYVSTISRLLVMSVITSGTPNKLRSQKHITHNTNHHRTLSMRTLRVRELCRHDRYTSTVNNQQRTWMLILVPTYSTKIFLGRAAMTTYIIPFVIGMTNKDL